MVSPQGIWPHPALLVVSHFLGIIPIHFSCAGFWGALGASSIFRGCLERKSPTPFPHIVNLHPEVTLALC